MPAIRTPTVVQQHIILVVFVVIIGATAWWQNAGGSVDYPIQKFASTSVPEFAAELDFSNAEAAWSGLQIDPQGRLKIDTLTETALVDTIALIRNQPSEEASQQAMARTTLLLEKQFGATASLQVMELLPLLAQYKDAEERWLTKNGSKNPLPHAELFRLQDEMLGKALAAKMFSQQRRLAEAMLTSQEVRNDTHLTQAEKDRALKGLEKTLQQQGAPSE